MNKDWDGNNKSVYNTLGANNHSNTERESLDYYATPSIAVEKLLEKESFCNNIFEPACGEGHISKVLVNHGYNVTNNDIIYRNYGNFTPSNFLDYNNSIHNTDIITNPPYKYALDFVKKSLDIIDNNHKVAMLLKIQFLEGNDRGKFFKDYPPKKIYVFSNRIVCGLNGNFKDVTTDKGYFKSAVCYAWYIWEKGYSGPSIVDWITEKLTLY